MTVPRCCRVRHVVKTIGMEVGKTYRFVQTDRTNYFLLLSRENAPTTQQNYVPFVKYFLDTCKIKLQLKTFSDVKKYS